MTRKRFVKLLMSNGYDRNEASEAAKIARCCGIQYDNHYLYLVLLPSVAKAAKTIIESVVTVSKAIVNGIQAFLEAYRQTFV